MNVLVLNPPSKFTRNAIRDVLAGCWCKGKRIAGTTLPPLTLLGIATILRQEGHGTRLLDAVGEMKTLDEVAAEAARCDVVVVPSATMSMAEDAEVLAALKRANPQLATVAFGAHPTFMPEQALRWSSLDVIVRGEPDFVVRDLITALSKGTSDWQRLQGIGFRQNGRTALNEPYPLIDDLDTVPFPDWTMLPKDIVYFNPLAKRLPFATSLTSRGCPAKCTFCSAPKFYGNRIRCRSAANVVQEMELLAAQGFREIFYRDELFTTFRKRNRDICEEVIRRKLDVTWICSARVGTVDKPTLALMKRAGCHTIRFGVESGVQRILDNVRKGIRLEQTRETFRWANEVGLNTHAHMMLGMPGETRQTLRDTIRFVKEIRPTTATFGICTPYPGTELFEEVARAYPQIQDGTSVTLGNIHTTSLFNELYTSVPSGELESSIKRAYREFYFRPAQLGHMLRRVHSFGELSRMARAGLTILSFSVEGDDN